MSALFARLGLAESRLALLLAVRGRGTGAGRRVRGGGGECQQQVRTASWWKKKSYDDTVGGDEFGLDSQLREAEEKWQELKQHELRQTDVQVELEQQDLKEQELEVQRKTSEIVRGVVSNRGWGLGDSKEDEQQAAQPSQPKADQLSWSQGSGDTVWDAISRPAESDAEPVRREHSRAPGWGLIEAAMPGMVTDAVPADPRPVSKDTTELGWSRNSEDAFWEKTERSDTYPEPPKDAFSGHAPVKAERPFNLPTKDNQSSNEEWLKPRSDPLLNINYEFWLPKALEEKDQDKVARCLYAAQDRLDFGFVERIPEDTFTEVLRILEPQHNIGEIAEAYSGISEYAATQIGLMRPDQLMFEYGQMLQEVAFVRRRNGRRLTAAQYITLLRSAEYLGNWQLAKRLWEDLKHDDIQPDVHMYNAYLAAMMRIGWNSSSPKHRERVLNFNMLARKARRRDIPYASYSIGTPGGVKERSMVVLDAMLKNGITATEETYRSIITAAAREGEMDTVRSVLKTVWNIDIKELMSPNRNETEPLRARELPRDSPHYPTPQLLWTLGHAFGMNSNIPTALRVVDFVSREYDIDVPRETWAILFEWTFVLAGPRWGSSGRADRKLGQLPRSSLTTLWNTMTGDPYLVRPTMGMYTHMIKNLSIRGEPKMITAKMERAKPLADESRAARDTAWEDFERCLIRQELDLPIESLAMARRRWEGTAIIHAKNHRWMKRWMRLLLRSLVEWHRRRHERGTELNNTVTLRTIPRLLWNWRSFADTHVQYDLPTGVLEIEMKTEREVLRNARRRESTLLKREKAMREARLVVGDGLLSLPVDEETGQPVAATRRLRVARGEKGNEPDEDAGGGTMPTYVQN